MLKFLLWLILFVMCWPVAIIGLILFPIVWLITLPFRLVGIVFKGFFELFKGIIFLPARMLGRRPS